MIIGLGSNNLQTYLGGVQTWTRTVAEAIEKIGYQYCLYDVNCKKIPLANIHIIAHNSIMRKHLRENIPASLIIHGVIPRLERPIAGASKYFAVSEETQQFCDKLGFDCSRIIRNPINTDIFENVGCRKSPQKVLFNNYRRSFPFLDEFKKRFEIIELNQENRHEHIEHLIADADIVIATGRAAYEAMSMGKNVIISGQGDYKGGEYLDGFIDNDTFLKFRRFNCSGRYLMRKAKSWADYEKEIAKYSESQGFRNARLIREHNDYIKIARELILNAR